MVTVKRRASPQTLSQFAELASLAPQQLEILAEASTVEELPAGRLLFKPGMREHENLYLVSGEIALMANHQAVGSVVGGTEGAGAALAPERPRELWGWTKSKCQVVCVDAGLVDHLRSNDPALAANMDSLERALREQLSQLQHRLRQTEQERDEARAQLQALRSESSSLQQELERRMQHAQAQLRDLREAPANQSATRETRPAKMQPPPPVREKTASVVGLSANADDGADQEHALPNLRIDPNERHALEPSELDDLLGSEALEIPADRRCRGHHH